MNKSTGFTLFEVIVAIGIVIILGTLVFSSVKQNQAITCQNDLIKLIPDETSCINEKANNDQNCVACNKYNAAAAQFNASDRCKEYGPIGTYVCPNPPPPN